MRSDQMKKGLERAPHRSLFKALGLTERYEENLPAKDWRPGGGGGPRRIIREDLAI